MTGPAVTCCDIQFWKAPIAGPVFKDRRMRSPSCGDDLHFLPYALLLPNLRGGKENLAATTEISWRLTLSMKLYPNEQKRERSARRIRRGGDYRNTVSAARGDRDSAPNTGNLDRHIAVRSAPVAQLAGGVIAPRPHGPVGFQRQAVVGAAGGSGR